MLSDLKIWLNHFEYHARQPRTVPREISNVLTLKERRAIADSLATFQLGEDSDGTRLTALAQHFAARHELPQIVPIVRLLIEEEQRHAYLLGAFLDGHGLPRRRHALSDGIFRRLRHLGGFELAFAVLLSAELIGIVYYRALEAATRCKHLQALCRTLLADEHAHVGFESSVLLELAATRSPVARAARRLALRVLFAGAVATVWCGHRAVLARAGHSFASCRRACTAQYDFYLQPAAALAPVLRRAPAQVANSCAEMSRNDLNSRALPEGSSRNIVACAPGAPLKRT